MNAASAKTLLAHKQTLFPAHTLNLPNPLIHINAAKHTHLHELHDILPLYAAGPEHQEPVILGQYPEPLIVDTRQHFLAATGNTLILEQIPYHLLDKPDAIRRAAQALHESRAQAMTIDAPILLVGRYGYQVWGHWLHEMLAKIVAVETAFPRRLSYAVPADITLPGPTRSYSTAVLESLAAYGIGADRLIRLPPGHVIEFRNAFDATGIWQRGLHHDIARLMRAIVADIPVRPDQRLMVMRQPADMRAIYNGPEIAHLLANEGFTAIDPRGTTFLQQAQAFAASPIIAGELGSNLANLIFAPRNVRLLSFAPFGWIDAYFLHVMKERAGHHADIRGPTTQLRGPDPHLSPFVIDPADARDGLSALNNAETPNTTPFIVAGQPQPRALGSEILHLRFAAGANGHAHLRGKWHPPEANHIWSNQDVAIIEIPPANLPKADTWLEIRGFSVSYPNHMPVRHLGVTVNGVTLAQTRVTGNVRVIAQLPKSALTGRKKIAIEIHYPRLGPAKFLGAAGDERELGIGLTDIIFYAPATGSSRNRVKEEGWGR